MHPGAVSASVSVSVHHSLTNSLSEADKKISNML